MRDDHKSWYANTPPNPFPLPLKERIRLAKEHADKEEQRYNSLWPYQRFALTIGELLDAAERGA